MKYKSLIFGILLSIIFLGCNGCGDSEKVTVDTKKADSGVTKGEDLSGVSEDKTNEKSKVDNFGKTEDQSQINPKPNTTPVPEKQNITPVSADLAEEGSPANPYTDMEEDDDPNSPQNAQKVVEDLDSLPKGHPANAYKIENDDPDLLEKGSPANPIEDITGEDIAVKD